MTTPKPPPWFEALVNAPDRAAFDAAIREDGVTPEAEAAYAKYRQWLEKSLHDGPSLSADTVWEEWEAKAAAEQPDAEAIQSHIRILLHKAFMRFQATGDTRLLSGALVALQSPEALAVVNPESIARLIELLDARRQPLKAGRPKGQLNRWRWRSARHVAAHLVEMLKTAWRNKHNQDKVPAKVVEKFVLDVIKEMKAGEAAKRRQGLRCKPLTRERVLALLNEAKGRRL
jgi:hypothetical protein